MKLTVLRDGVLSIPPSNTETVITWDELRHRIRGRGLPRLLLRYDEVRLRTYRLDVLFKPFNAAVLLRLLSRNGCYFEDDSGRRQAITIAVLARLFRRLVVDFGRHRVLLTRLQRELDALEHAQAAARAAMAPRWSAAPVYLRTDLAFGVRSGGSVGHVAGVVNHLGEFTGKAPILLATDPVPTVRADLETHLLPAGAAFWDFPEVASFSLNAAFERDACAYLRDRDIAFIYQRYSVNNYSGVKLARHYGVPLVLEFNGSEIWAHRNWGKPLKYEALSARIELLNLHAADVITAISRPIQDELLARGIAADKILLNPNGVDADRYRPDLDGSQVRRRHGLADKTVIGFIGTFGPWHGAEVLAEAFGRLLQAFPHYRESVRVLMVGDGATMPLVRENLARLGAADLCILTGRLPQEEGPEHLAAADLLASPHVPNADGTPFFGSPTKLFEYMAMGKGIVASNLDQIGEVLQHNHTAWMVTPGDPGSLMHGLKALIDDAALRARLGAAARREVVAKYTWRAHTQRIIEKLKERCGG